MNLNNGKKIEIPFSFNITLNGKFIGKDKRGAWCLVKDSILAYEFSKAEEANRAIEAVDMAQKRRAEDRRDWLNAGAAFLAAFIGALVLLFLIY